jgi:hypothetical protein
MRAGEIEGWVVIEFDISPSDDKPQNVHVLASSHSGGPFDVAVRRAFDHNRSRVNIPYENCRSITRFQIRK